MGLLRTTLTGIIVGQDVAIDTLSSTQSTQDGWGKKRNSKIDGLSPVYLNVRLANSVVLFSKVGTKTEINDK